MTRLLARNAAFLTLALVPVWSLAAAPSNGVAAVAARTPVAVVVAPAVAPLDRYLEQSAAEGFSGGVLVVKGGEVLLRQGYGMGDRGRSRRIKPNMVFDLGSVTKVITAATVLGLQADGRIDLTAPVSRYLPGIPPGKAAITVEQLLRHTSGLPESLGEDEDFVTRDWLLSHAWRAPLVSKPGESDNYSNVGYSVLAAIIEVVTEKPYETFVRERALAPTGVNDIGYIEPNWEKERMVCGVRSGKPWGSVRDYFAPQGPSWHLVGNGGMMASMDDLERWFEGFLANKITPESLTKVFVDAVARPTQRGTRAITVTGSNAVFSSIYVKWLEEDMSLVLFTSNSDWQRDRVLPRILEELRTLVATPARPSGS